MPPGPGDWFAKKLLPVEEMLAVLDEAIHRLLDFNPKLQIMFTISPVRHIRDGVIENNRSKARLIEVVHQLVGKFNRTYYFPAYELVIDVLRDYRFYDKDLVHPNYMATNYVVENFMEHYVHPEYKIAGGGNPKITDLPQTPALFIQIQMLIGGFSRNNMRKHLNCREISIFGFREGTETL